MSEMDDCLLLIYCLCMLMPMIGLNRAKSKVWFQSTFSMLLHRRSLPTRTNHYRSWFQTNIVIFTPKVGEAFQFDEHIFQMGWFNHQPDSSFQAMKIDRLPKNCWRAVWGTQQKHDNSTRCCWGFEWKHNGLLECFDIQLVIFVGLCWLLRFPLLK